MNETAPPSLATPPRRRRALAWLLLSGALLLLTLALTTPQGLRVLLRTVVPSLEFSALEGNLLEGATLRELRFSSPRVALSAASVSLAWRFGPRAGLVLREVRATALTLIVPADAQRTGGAAPRVPLPVRVESLRIDGLNIVRAARRYAFSALSAAFELTPSAWTVRDFALHGPTLALSGHGRYADARVSAVLSGEMSGGHRPARAELNLDGALDAIAVELQFQAPLLASLRGELDARATPPRVAGEWLATVPALGPLSGQLEGDLEHLRLRVAAALDGAPPALRDVHLDVDMPAPLTGGTASLRWQAGQAAVMRGEGTLRWQDGGLRVALDSATPAASVRARALFEHGGIALGARLRWQDLALRDAGALPSTGALRVRGRLDHLFVDGALRASEPRFGALAARLRGTLEGGRFELARLDARLFDGEAHASGSADGHSRCVRLVFDFRRLDFAHVDAALTSRLDGLGRAHACQLDRQWHGALVMERLAGRWRDHTLSARGEVEHGDRTSVVRGLRVEVAGNRLDADLEFGARLAGRFALDAPDLGVVLPTLAGHLRATGAVAGRPDAPTLRAHVEGGGLAAGAWRAAAVQADVDVDATRLAASSVNFAISDLARGKQSLGALRGHGRGTPAHHALDLSLHGKDLDASLRAQGAWQAPRWSGAVTRVRLVHARLGSWQLAAIAPLAWQRDELDFGPACVAQQDARLCLALPRWRADSGAAQLDLSGLPLMLARPWLPASLEPRGRVSASLALQRVAGRWQGNGQAAISDGALGYAGAGRAREELPLRDARADFTLDTERLHATAGLELGQWLRVHGTVSAGLADLAPVRGKLDLDMPDIRWLEEFWPELAGSSGSAQLSAELQGARHAPRLAATLRSSSGALRMPRFGTEVRAVDIAAEGELGTPLAVRGEARVGDGRVRVQGQFDAEDMAGPRALLRVHGEGLALVRLPDIEADAAPKLELTLAPGRMDLGGQVTWSRVQIQMPDLPERAISTSSDVVLVNGTEELPLAAPPTRWFVDSLAADVGFTLGDQVALTAAGIEARLNGAVHWHKPRGVARGSGRGGLNIVDGHYKAYGQELKIQRGALIFDGAIDNPSLDVRAIRADLEDVVAGVRVTGTLRMPKFALFAEPSLPDAEVLSYLVTGHALANASSGEAGVIARAALSLGADRAALVTSQLSNLFALDEFGINPGNTARTSSIVAGKRLTPKLTVRSEFNPFERLWTFFLNYKLSPRWSVEAQTGAGQGADVIYSVERDTLGGAEAVKSDPAPPPPSP